MAARYSRAAGNQPEISKKLELANTVPHDPNVKPESIELMRSLLARPEAAAAAAEAFRRAYPDAPQAMIDAAVFHVVSEGIEASVDWLAAIETFIRNPEAGFDYGAVWHVVYHLYNWQQFEALLPIGRDGLKEDLKDVRQLIEEDDKDAALDVLKRLVKALQADVKPPGVE